MSRSSQRVHEPQKYTGIWVFSVKIHVFGDCKVRSLCFVIKRVLVGFVRVTLATPPGLDQRSFSWTKSRRELRRTSSFDTFGWFVECELVVVESGLIATCSVTCLLWTAACTIGEYKKCLFVWSMADIKSLQIEIQAALCALSEEKLKEVCRGLKITLPPESKGRFVFIRVLNIYI